MPKRLAGLLLIVLLSGCSDAPDADAPEAARRGAAGSAATAAPAESNAASGPFSMQIQDVFNITGRGTVVTGRIASGTVATGDALCLTAADGRTRSLQVAGIEQFRKMSESASAGDNVGLLVSGLTKSDIAIGDMLEPACD